MYLSWTAFASEQALSNSITVSHLYKRSIDDVLIGHHHNITPPMIADLLNSFHADISGTHDAGEEGQGLSFLDLSIQQLESHDGIRYKLYREPTNLYTYLPWKS